eukprot:s190_g20.t2
MGSVESGASDIMNIHAEGSLSFLAPKASSTIAEFRQLRLDDVLGRCPEVVEPLRDFYVPFAGVGLPLQPRFRTVRSIQRSKDEIIAWVAEEEDGTNAGFFFGPSVIDGSFQASCAFQNLEAMPNLRIPLSIDRVQLLGQGFSTKVWVRHVLRNIDDKQMEADLEMAKDDLTVVLTMDRMRLREVRPDHIAKMLAASARDADEDLLEVDWAAVEGKRVDDEAHLQRPLFVGASAALQPFLESVFPDARCVGKDTVEAVLLDPGNSFTSILHVAALGEAHEMEVVQSALQLMQVILKRASSKLDVPPVWCVTHGTQHGTIRSYLHSGLWGLARTFRAEEPSVKLHCLDLDGTLSSPEALAAGLKQWLIALKETVETEVAIAGSAFAARLSRSKAKPQKPLELLMSMRGSLSNLRPVVQESRRAPKGSEVELRIRAVGLNFRDVLNVMGLYPGDPGPPGADCAGSATDFCFGQDVFGESPGCLKTYNVGPGALLTMKPKTWSFEEACCMPVIFVTVEEALRDLANLKRGERVLIHAAAGGVGLVAIQYAQLVGAEVYATAGADSKHEFLRSLGVKFVTSSRNAAQFEEELSGFLTESEADGVDVVLNSLSHDRYIPLSLSFLKKGGRFIEIGKRGIWTHEEMYAARPDVLYEKIAADTMMENEPWRYNAYLNRLLSRVEEGTLKPINMHTFEGMDKAVAAMQFLQRAQNVGKVVIRHPSTLGVKPDSHYVLSGGLGALGMVTASYLVEEGAKSMTLLSRSGRPSGDVAKLWAALKEASVELSATPCDITMLEDVQALGVSLKTAQKLVSGLIHLAAVLDDATLPKLTPGHLERSYAAKVHGLRHLRLCLCQTQTQSLDFALLFSSTSALFGSPGQGNYAAANAALDGHARYWKTLQEPVVSVQWGPWKEVGMAAQKGTVERLRASGIGSLSNAFGMAALAGCLQWPLSTTLVAQPMRWAAYLKQYAKVPPFLSRFVSEVRTAKPKSAPALAVRAAAAAPALPRLDKVSLRQMLQSIASEVVGGGVVDQDAPLMDSGMDSLSAVEFRNRFTSKLPGVNLPNTLTFDYPTISSIADFSASQMGPAPAGPGFAMVLGPSSEEVKELLKRTASDTTGGLIEEDKPLMESGMDSLSAVELIFDYPTIASIAGYAAEQLATTAAPRVEGAGSLLKGPPQGSLDEQLSVVGMAAYFPGAASDSKIFHTVITKGVDGGVEVPFARWELEDVWDPNPDAPGKMYPRHGNFVDGVELFDAKYFGISPPEARAMDPQQRLLLETSMNSLQDSSLERPGLMGREVAVHVGMTNNDWIQIQSCDSRKISPYTATGMSFSVAAGRISYALGLKGPSYIVDTACSSALVALDCSATALRKGRCTAALSAAANIMTSATTYISFSKPRMLSATGRCLTFDASADGYARGEGAGAVVLRKPNDVITSESVETSASLERCALLGVAVNQDGRSSTLTAPNGPSQHMVMMTALAEARLVPEEIVHMECHGTGTPLGDPIEIGGIKSTSTSRSADTPLILAAVKSNCGHLEGPAASTGLIKSVAIMEHAASMSSLHLRQLNPSVAALHDLPGAFVTEAVPISNLAKQSAGELCRVGGGLSSFGFGGTNAHGVVSAATVAGEASRLRLALKEAEAPRRSLPIVFERRNFSWREVGYRFLRAKPSHGIFEVAMSMDVYDVVKHHVVFGSIVVPGVVFVEMALEATREMFGAARITDVNMMFPFVVPIRTGTEPAAVMRFVLKSDTRFQIESTSATGTVTVHAEGGINRSARSEDPETTVAPVDLEALKARVVEAIPAKDVYAVIDSLGLYLGPMFQTAKELWRKEPDEGSESNVIEVLGRLKLDDGVPNLGYVLHPAVFDGTIHTLATASVGKNVNDLKIFGGVGRVSVVQSDSFSHDEEYWIWLSIKEKLEASETFDVKVMSGSGAVLLLMENVVFRKVLPEQIQMAIAAQSATEDDQKIYEIEWQEVEEEEEVPDAEERWLVLHHRASQSFMEELESHLGKKHRYADLVASADWGKLQDYSRVVSLAGVANLSEDAAEKAATEVLEALAATLKVMQEMAGMASKDAGMPELWLPISLSNSVLEGDLSSSAELPASHAGIWGLAKAFRIEHPELRTVSLDLADVSASGLARQLRHSEPDEPELAVRNGTSHVPRLVDSTARLQNAQTQSGGAPGCR